MLPYIEPFGLHIDLYALCVVVGMLCVALLFRKLYKRRGLDGRILSLEALFALGGVFIGSHILYGITQFDLLTDIIADPKYYIKSFDDFSYYLDAVFGGMVFYGGLIGGVLMAYLFLAMARVENKADYADLFIPAIPLFHAFGRVGCFCAGCCYGIESQFGFSSSSGLSKVADGVSRFPVQLLESLLNLFLAALLTYLFKKEYKRGRLLRVYFFIYPVIRFFDELLRGDKIRGFLGPLSTSQWISIGLFTIAVVWKIVELVLQKRKKPKEYV